MIQWPYVLQVEHHSEGLGAGVCLDRRDWDCLVVLLRDGKLMLWSLGDLLDSWNSVAEFKEDKAYLAFFCLRYPPVARTIIPQKVMADCIWSTNSCSV